MTFNIQVSRSFLSVTVTAVIDIILGDREEEVVRENLTLGRTVW